MVSKGYYRLSEIPWEKRWSMAFQNHEINTKVHTPLYFGETVSAILSYGIYDMFESKYEKKNDGLTWKSKNGGSMPGSTCYS